MSGLEGGPAARSRSAMTIWRRLEIGTVVYLDGLVYTGARASTSG